jgi:hypothetical protein
VRTTVAAVFAVLALAVLVLPAAAVDEVDQEASTLPSDGAQSWAALDALRQTFTPDASNITKVELYFQAAGMAATSGDVDVTVEVKRAGFIPVDGSDIVTVPAGFEGGWITFDFPTAEIVAGETYEIKATVSDNGQGLAWGYTNTEYAGGEASTVSGMTLTPQLYDFLFKTYSEECGGVILFGSAPPPGGGFGTFAFDCGSLEELVAASGCPEETATFFYNKPDGGFAVYIPGTEIGIVNEEFMTIFSGDPAIEETTIFTAKCV